MKKIICLLTLLGICGCIVHAQITAYYVEALNIKGLPKTWKDFQLKGKVKQVSVGTSLLLVFTPEGYLQFEGKLNDKNEPEGTAYTYTSDGYLLKLEKGTPSKVTYTEKYSYDKQKRLIEKVVLRDGTQILKLAFYYQDNGNTCILKIDDMSVLLKNKFNSKNKLVKIEEYGTMLNHPIETTTITYLMDGGVRYEILKRTTKNTYEYSSQGKLRKKLLTNRLTGDNILICDLTFDNKGNLLKSSGKENIDYDYNEKGDIKTCNTTIPQQSYQNKKNYKYTAYDKHGNWIERNVHSLTEYQNIQNAKSEINEVEKRVIVYYDEYPMKKPINSSLSTKDRNILIVLINKPGMLLVRNDYVDDLESLKDKVKEFIVNPYNDDDLPEKYKKQLPYFGEILVTSKHVISVQRDVETNNNRYQEIMSTLKTAYEELHNEMALMKFGRKFVECSLSEQKAILQIYPQKIVEQEPLDLSKGSSSSPAIPPPPLVPEVLKIIDNDL